MKNKKILGALAALCMGVILCVSSVFAVNYWYRIDGESANTVSTGKSLALNLADATNDNGAGLYPGGIVTFEDITVEGAFKWSVAENGVVNPELPKFALIIDKVEVSAAGGITKVDDFYTKFTVYQNENDSYVKVGNKLLADNMVIFSDLQTLSGDGSDIEFDLRLAFDADADVAYEQHTLTITLKVVAYLGTEATVGAALSDDVILGVEDPADADNDTLNPDNGGVDIDPTTGVERV